MSDRYAVVPPARAFDLAEFITAPRPITLSEPALGEVTGSALPTAALWVLDHLHRVERATLDWLRDVLISPTQVDAEVTAFLTTWAYEKYWLAHTLSQVLSAHPPVPTARPGPRARVARQLYERARPTVAVIGTNLAGPAVTAGHIATGLADTLALRVTVIRLAHLVPGLSPLTEAVLHSTERHVAFYTGQAHHRTGVDAGSRRWVGTALRRWQWPGSRHADPRRVGAVLRYLFAHPGTRPVIGAADAALAALTGAPARAVLRTEFARFVVHGTTGGQLRVQ